MKRPTVLLAMLVVLGLSLLLAASIAPAPARAQGGSATPGTFEAADTVPNQQDFRGRVVTAVALMFIFIIGFVLWSQRKGSGMREELDHLKRRIDELEAKRGP